MKKIQCWHSEIFTFLEISSEDSFLKSQNKIKGKNIEILLETTQQFIGEKIEERLNSNQVNVQSVEEEASFDFYPKRCTQIKRLKRKLLNDSQKASHFSKKRS